MFDTDSGYVPAVGEVTPDRFDTESLATALRAVVVLPAVAAWAVFWAVVVWFQLTSGGALDAVATAVLTQGIAAVTVWMLLVE